MLRLTFLLLALMVTTSPFCDPTCFAAVVLGHHYPGKESGALNRFHRRSFSKRQYTELSSCRAPQGAWYGIRPNETYCTIHKKTGELGGCVKASKCPAGVTGFEMVCDPTSDHCCCKGDKPLGSQMACNDIGSQENDTVRIQACKLPELSGLRWCTGPSWTTPKPIFRCVTQEPNGTRTEDECTDPNQRLCGIDKQTGSAIGCVSGSDCPDGTRGYVRGTVLCKSMRGKPGRHCCCPNREGGPTTMRCNDIFNVDDNTVWRKACGQDELKHLWVCQRSWTTTPRPPPTPRHPPPPFVTARNMSRHCLEYCIDNAPDGNLGPFELRCGDPVPGQPAWNCPPPCPLGCDRYCDDGTNLKCPKLPKPKPPTTSSNQTLVPPGRSNISVSVLEPPKPFVDDEEDKPGPILVIVIAAVASIFIIGVIAYCIWFKNAPLVHPQSAPMLNTSAYPGSGGAPSSATSISSSLSGNQSSSSVVQMTPQSQQARPFQQAAPGPNPKPRR